MIAKKVGYLLLIKLKLYLIIKKIGPLLLAIGCILTFTNQNINHTKERYQFQQPSLRTRLFQTFDQNTNIKRQQKQQVKFQSIDIGIQIAKFKGFLQNQCLLIVFPEKMLQSQQIYYLYKSLSRKKILSKNIVLLSYENTTIFQLFMNSFYSKNRSHKHNFGIIRQSLSINVQYSTLIKRDKAFIQIYGENGYHSDVDFWQAVKQLLQALHIQWSPCKIIHKNTIYKIMRKYLQKGIQFISSFQHKTKQNSNILVDSLLCQFDNSLSIVQGKFNNSQPHLQMMKMGFQSVFVEVILSSNSEQSPTIQSRKKVSKFLYSFLNQFLAQQDHLHSSTTHFYPISNSNFISMVGTLYSGLLVLIVSLLTIIGQLVQNHDKLEINLKKNTLILIWLMGWQYVLTQNFTVSFLTAIPLKLIFNYSSENKKQVKQIQQNELPLYKNRMWYLILAGIQFLFSIYFCIFNYSLFHISVILGVVMLFFSKLKIFLIVLLACVGLAVWKLYYTSFLLYQAQDIMMSLKYGLLSFNSLSVEIKSMLFPILFWILD